MPSLYLDLILRSVALSILGGFMPLNQIETCRVNSRWLRAPATIYPGIGTKAETGVRNGWNCAPATIKTPPPSPVEAAVFFCWVKARICHKAPTDLTPETWTRLKVSPSPLGADIGGAGRSPTKRTLMSTCS